MPVIGVWQRRVKLSSIVVAGDTSGSVTLSAPAVAGSTTLTLPSVSGTVLTSASSQVTGPAFSAYQSSATSLSNNTLTKITFTTSEFDTSGGMYASSRFTPTIAGYYQVLGMVSVGALNPYSTIYKNGSEFKRGSQLGGAITGVGCLVTALIYLNGSSDYVEIYTVQNSGTTQTTNTGVSLTYFQASMVRSA